MFLPITSVLMFFVLHNCDGTFYHRRGPLIPVKTEVSVWYPGRMGPMVGPSIPYRPSNYMWINQPRIHGNVIPDATRFYPHVHTSYTHHHHKVPNWIPPQGTVYPDTGIQWQLPNEWKNTNTWDLVNPDSIITAEVLIPDDITPGTDNIPDKVTIPGTESIPTRGDLFADAFPSSDKEKDPVIVKPLEPTVRSVIGTAMVTPDQSSDKTSNDNGPTMSPNQDLDIKFVFPEFPVVGNDETKNIDTSVRDDATDDESASKLPSVQVPKDNKTDQSCHEIGCQTGSQCVYADTWICPNYIQEVPCKCKPGCRVDNTFIPLGSTVTIDTCGNTCSCNNIYGKADCTSRPCGGTSIPATDVVPVVGSKGESTTTKQNVVGSGGVQDGDSTNENVIMTFPKIPIAPSPLSKV